MPIFCDQLESGCIQPVGNRSPTFLILCIFLPGNHGLHVGLAAVMTWNNPILSHCMFPVTKSSFCKGFPVLPKFCGEKTTWITVCCISLSWIFKPTVPFVPLKAKTTTFIPFQCGWKLYIWVHWGLIWSSSNICWNITCCTCTGGLMVDISSGWALVASPSCTNSVFCAQFWLESLSQPTPNKNARLQESLIMTVVELVGLSTKTIFCCSILVLVVRLLLPALGNWVVLTVHQLCLFVASEWHSNRVT